MLSSELKSLLQFKSTSLYDDADQGYLNVFGTNSVVTLVSGGGYSMQDDQYLYGGGIAGAGYNMTITNAMTLGFWLYPISPGVATDESTGAAVPITMPLFAWDPASSDETPVIKIYESTTVDGNNKMIVSFLGGSYSVSTEEYTPAAWHHFWIAYDGSGPTLSVYIDGKAITLQNVSGSVPSSLGGDALDLYINHFPEGYSSSRAKNTGYITDLFVYNTLNTTEADIQTVINKGILYLADTNYNTLEEEGFGIRFDDPQTITITSSVDDMSYIFAGRNDGKIMRGSSLLWETRRIFSNPDENTNVNESSGFLEINDTTIRL